MSSDTALVVGLGNPGPRYAGNRHNVGHMVIRALAERRHDTLKSHKSGLDLAETRIGDVRTVLALSRGFMNESGGPVKAASQFFRVEPERLVVIHDELDLPFGAIRLKLGGGDNGHNGLKSIRSALGTGEFIRVRCGIGRPPGRMDPADYVLADYAPRERDDLAVQVQRAADAVAITLTESLAAAQNAFND
jgi:peptidyl-tRNA hydrolase, PTH1 family